MLKSIVRSVVCLALLSHLAGVAPATADPIAVTGGSFTSTLSSSSFMFTGTGLQLSAGGDGLASSLFECTPCTANPATTLSFDGTLLGAQLSGGAPGEYQGVQYEHTHLAGSFEFAGPSFSTASLSPSSLIVSAPFSMMASLSNYASGVTTSEPPIFTATLIGSGIATARFVMNPPGDPQLFTLENVTYQFNSSDGTPTPEPASMLLFGSGMAGLVIRRRRRHE